MIFDRYYFIFYNNHSTKGCPQNHKKKNMKFSLHIITTLIIPSAFGIPITKEKDILVLTQKNFEAAISKNKLILVAFYAPWCGYSKALLPEYAKAAEILARKDTPFKLAKVDATQEVFLAYEFGIRGYPTLIFFHNGKPIQYNGGHTSDTIMFWVEEFLRRSFVKENDAVGFPETEGDLNLFKNFNKNQ